VIPLRAHRNIPGQPCRPPMRPAGEDSYPAGSSFSHGYPGNRFFSHLARNIASKGYVWPRIDHATALIPIRRPLARLC